MASDEWETIVTITNIVSMIIVFARSVMMAIFVPDTGTSPINPASMEPAGSGKVLCMGKYVRRIATASPVTAPTTNARRSKGGGWVVSIVIIKTSVPAANVSVPMARNGMLSRGKITALVTKTLAPPPVVGVTHKHQIDQQNGGAQ
jgi:hypothetical protein